MKEKFIEPEMEIIRFDNEDVITTSGYDSSRRIFDEEPEEIECEDYENV